MVDQWYLFKSQLCSLRNFILDERKTFMFLHRRIPAHGNASNGSERQKRLSQRVFLHLEVDAADVDATHEDDGLMSLKCFGLLLLMGQSLFHENHFDALLHRVLLRPLNVVILEHWIRGHS